MRKADYVFILCMVWPAARALPAVRIKTRSVWWGLVSHLYNEFPGWVGGPAVSLPLPGVVSENNMFTHINFQTIELFVKSPLSLGLLAPSIPSFSGICKVRKFY
jgi:hypothetical protein